MMQLVDTEMRNKSLDELLGGIFLFVCFFVFGRCDCKLNPARRRALTVCHVTGAASQAQITMINSHKGINFLGIKGKKIKKSNL